MRVERTFSQRLAGFDFVTVLDNQAITGDGAYEMMKLFFYGIEVVEDTYTGLYAGFGFVQRAGGRASMYMSFLWDFSYDDNEPSPNTNPWLIRIGIGYNF